MTSALERKLHEALQSGAAAVDPAPDLFERVAGSIAADRRRRQLRMRAVVVLVLLVASMGAAVWGLSDSRDGRLLMPWWALEIITIVVLVGVALWLGPFIKRFGRAYAADVFRANPRTGKSYILLTDIVYYLIFTSYILFTMHFEPADGWSSTVGAEQVQASVFRLAGILLVIGVLHGLNIVIMPVLGRLFSLNRRLDALNQKDDLDG